MESWDLFDENRKALNRAIKRGEEKKQGEYHIVVSIWTVNSKGEILVTLRDPHKEVYPNTWENTGGSVLVGETSRQGAVRELYEETGISALEDELILLGTFKEESAFVDIYLLKRDIGLEELTMQEGETVDAKWITIDTLWEWVEDHTLALPIGERLNDVWNEFKKHLDGV